VSKGKIPTPAGNETPVIQPTTSHFSELFQFIFGGQIGSLTDPDKRVKKKGKKTLLNLAVYIFHATILHM